MKELSKEFQVRNLSKQEFAVLGVDILSEGQ